MPQVALSEWVEQVVSGSALVSFPTDTVPALAARPDCSDRIYVAKERPADKPLILMGATWSDLQPYLTGSPAELEQWRLMADRYWPGALTLVLPASDLVPPSMNPLQTGTVGVRVPNHALARYLLTQTGPLATTSANRSGQPPLTDIVAINAAFPTVLTLNDLAIASLRQMLPAFTLEASDVPSTVIQWSRQSWNVLRQGSVRIEEAL